MVTGREDDRGAVHGKCDAGGGAVGGGDSGRGGGVRGFSGAAADAGGCSDGKGAADFAEDWYVYEFDWAPDGKQLAITAAQGNGDNNWYVAGLFAIEAASGTIHDVQPKPGMQIAGPKWSPDGKQIIYIGGLMSDEPIPGGDVYSTPVEGGAAKNSDAGIEINGDAADLGATRARFLLRGSRTGRCLFRDWTQITQQRWCGRARKRSRGESSCRTCRLQMTEKRRRW